MHRYNTYQASSKCSLQLYYLHSQAKQAISGEVQKLQQQLRECRSDLGSRDQQIAHYDFESQTYQVSTSYTTVQR